MSRLQITDGEVIIQPHIIAKSHLSLTKDKSEVESELYVVYIKMEKSYGMTHKV